MSYAFIVQYHLKLFLQLIVSSKALFPHLRLSSLSLHFQWGGILSYSVKVRPHLSCNYSSSQVCLFVLHAHRTHSTANNSLFPMSVILSITLSDYLCRPSLTLHSPILLHPALMALQCHYNFKAFAELCYTCRPENMPHSSWQKPEIYCNILEILKYSTKKPALGRSKL